MLVLDLPAIQQLCSWVCQRNEGGRPRDSHLSVTSFTGDNSNVHNRWPSKCTVPSQPHGHCLVRSIVCTGPEWRGHMGSVSSSVLTEVTVTWMHTLVSTVSSHCGLLYINYTWIKYEEFSILFRDTYIGVKTEEKQGNDPHKKSGWFLLRAREGHHQRRP